MPQLSQLLEYADELVRLHPSLVIGLVALVGFAAIWYVRSPRYVERTMARKKEREVVAQILSSALSDAVQKDLLNIKLCNKYHKLLGHALGLPDMIPNSPTARLWSSGFADLKKAKHLCIQRLNAMGVNIAAGLAKVRGKQATKKVDRLQIKRKSS